MSGGANQSEEGEANERKVHDPKLVELHGA